MASDIESHGSKYRISWYYLNARQRFSHADEDVVKACKAYVESIDHNISDKHATILRLEFLKTEAAERAREHAIDKRRQGRTFLAVATRLLSEREANGRMTARTAIQRERLLESPAFADWIDLDVATITTDMITAKKKSFLTQPWEVTNRSGAVSRRGIGYAPQTVAGYVSFALGVLHFAFKAGLITEDPTDNFDHERNPGGGLRYQFIDKAVWEEIVQLSSPETREFWEMLAGTGMRPNEGTALQTQYVRTGRNPSVNVQWAFGASGAQIRTLTRPKKLSTGVVTITPELAAKIEPYVRGKIGSDFVFTTETGKPWHLENLRRYHWNPMMQRAVRAGLISPSEVFTPYALRHSHGSWLLASGKVSLLAVSRRLRHKSIKTTADIYGHTTQRDEDAIMDIL